MTNFVTLRHALPISFPIERTTFNFISFDLHSNRTRSIVEKMIMVFSSLIDKTLGLWRKGFTRTAHTNRNAADPKWSYFSGCGSDPLLGYTVGQCLDVTASKYGDREALVVCHQNIRKTYSNFKADVDKAACGFLSLGLKKGDRVGIWSPSNYEWVVTQFATAKAGLILVCVNPGYEAHELEYSLTKVGMKAIVSAESFKSQNFYELLKSVLPSLSNCKGNEIQDDRFPHLRHIIMISEETFSGTLKFSDLLEAGSSKEANQLEKIQKEIQFDDPVTIQFTSGTTGKPKGATLSHHNIVNNAYFFGKRIEIDKKYHRMCIPPPLYHCVGNILGTLASVIFGNSAIIPSPVFHAKSTAEAVQAEKATTIYGTPTMYIDILNLPDFKKYNFTSLERGMMGGSPCPEEILKDVMERMHLKQFTPSYGCTETSPVILSTWPQDSFFYRTQTVGNALDYVEVKIVDGAGKVVPIGHQGELLARGYLVMKGYWGDEEKTKESITPNGWYKTGDIAIMDENGYVKIKGRKKDMVIRAGENIYPREIEEILHSNEKIAEVQVVGVPDKRMGEVLCAWIKVKENQDLTEDEVKAFCNDKMAHFKIPCYVIFTEEFPKTITGKIPKFILRENSIKKLDLKE